MIIPANKFDEMMEREFMPAAGQRRNCGAMPKRLAVRYMGKGGKSRYNADYNAYMKCVDEVRKMNIAQGLPPSTGLEGTLPPTGEKPTVSVETGSPQKTGTSPLMIGLYVVGGIAVVVGGVLLIKKVRAGQATTATVPAGK